MTIGMIAVLLMSVQAPLTLGETLRLPPTEAGDRALAGLQHGPIVTVERLPPAHLMPPGWVMVEMKEAPRREAQGCVRTVWVLRFIHDPSSPEDAARISSFGPRPEIALTSSQGCPETGYAKFAGKLTIPLAFSALQRLDSVIAGKDKRQIVCRNTTPSYLCENRQTTLRELAAIRPWMVTDHNGPLEIWLGTPGQVITTVTFDSDPNLPLVVSRLVPAPF